MHVPVALLELPLLVVLLQAPPVLVVVRLIPLVSVSHLERKVDRQRRWPERPPPRAHALFVLVARVSLVLLAVDVLYPSEQSVFFGARHPRLRRDALQHLLLWLASLFAVRLPLLDLLARDPRELVPEFVLPLRPWWFVLFVPVLLDH